LEDILRKEIENVLLKAKIHGTRKNIGSYEKYKRQIQNVNTVPSEYEQAIRQLSNILKV